jgi:hypothetical protein
MNQKEFEYWQSVTASSAHSWVEDRITSLNGAGALFYIGGENGRYMRLSTDGKLTVGTYEDAFPHIGEALFKQKTEHQFDSFDEALKAAFQLGGTKFLTDIFSSDMIPQEPSEDDDGMTMKM